MCFVHYRCYACYGASTGGSWRWPINIFRRQVLLDKAYGSQQGSHIFSGSSSSGYRFGNCVLGRKSDDGYGNGHAAGFCRYCPGAERLMKNKLAVLSGFMVCYWLSPWRWKCCQKLRCKGESPKCVCYGLKSDLGNLTKAVQCGLLMHWEIRIRKSPTEHQNRIKVWSWHENDNHQIWRWRLSG